MLAPTQTVVFAVESFAAAYPAASELVRSHWDEIAQNKTLLTLNPDLKMYEELERQGKLCVITARWSGELIGYIVMIMHAHPHYKHVLTATDDLHFLHPAHRKGLVGFRLIAAAKREMKRRGVQLMALRRKVKHDHGLLFERLGFRAQDVVYTMRLDEA